MHFRNKVLLIFVFAFLHCGFSNNPPSSTGAIKLIDGTSDFITEVSNLKSPTGVINCAIASLLLNSDAYTIIQDAGKTKSCLDAANYHEVFIYDEKTLLLIFQQPSKLATNLVISEIGVATDDTDYIEIYNPTSASINLNGITLYADSGCDLSNGWSANLNLSGTIAAGGYFLISSGGNPADVIPDQTGWAGHHANSCFALANGEVPTSTNSQGIIDIVSSAALGDLANPVINLASEGYMERKSCHGSTSLNQQTVYALSGNGFKQGESRFDFVTGPSGGKNPQNSASLSEPANCEPLLAIKLKSREFYDHLKREHNQFTNSANLLADNKKKNLQVHYREIGDYRVQLMFTPNELAYTTVGENAGRIQDKNSTTAEDLWRLQSAASELTAIIPEYYDTRIFADIFCQVAANKARFIYTADSKLALSDLPGWLEENTDSRYDSACALNRKKAGAKNRPWYEKRSIPKLRTPIFIGEGLGINDDLLGNAVEDYINRQEITEPFFFISSVPLGNGEKKDLGEDNLARRHGFGLLIRGDIRELKKQLNELGLPDQSNYDLIKTLSITSDATSILVNWAEQAEVQLQHSSFNSNKTSSEVINANAWTTLSSYNSQEAILPILTSAGCSSGIINKGCQHWFRVQGISTTPSLASLTIGDTPAPGELKLSEVMWAGMRKVDTANDAYDEWFEVKNTSAKVLSLASLDVYIDNDLTDNDLQENIVFGPNYNASASLSGHEAYNGLVYPGDYLVIARYNDRSLINSDKSKLLIRTIGNLSNSNLGILLGIGLGAGKALQIIDSKQISGSPGLSSSAGNKSAVLQSDGSTWASSTIDSKLPSAGLNFGTPGYAGPGEY